MTIYDRKLTELSSGEADFDIRDKQGRAVGYRWIIFRAVFTPVPEGQRSGYTQPANGLPLEHLMIAAFPTRNSKHYGASSGYLHCLTQDEAAKLIARRIEAARKRDSKKFGGAL